MIMGASRWLQVAKITKAPDALPYLQICSKLARTTFQWGAAALKEFMSDAEHNMKGLDKIARAPMAHDALLACDGDYTKRKNGFLSQLFMPGSLVCRQYQLLDDCAYWVLLSNVIGALTWRVSPLPYDGGLWVKNEEEDTSFDILQCHNPK